MKIFSWVQRRFNHVPLKDELAQKKRAAEEFTSEADKQALLKQEGLVGVLGGWKDGILTIGTLGFDPVKTCNEQNDYFVLASEAEDNTEEEQPQQFSIECDSDNKIFFEDDELNPLILTGSKRLLEEGETNNMLVVGGISNVSEVTCEQKKNNRERVTLLELFQAESEDKMAKKKEMLGGLDDQPYLPAGKMPVPCPKNGKSFAKKHIAHGPDDSHPIKKFNRLMRRMLRKKIHPELEGKGCKMGDQKKPNAASHVNKRNEATEFAFLLRTLSGATI